MTGEISGALEATLAELASLERWDEMTDGTTHTYEAEDMDISGGYTEQSYNGASGGGYVQTWSEGSISTTFDGAAGTYKLDLTAFDENDGQSTLQVVVNGNVVATLVLDEDSGGNYIYDTSTVLEVDGIELAPGDTFEIRGISDSGEAARVDKIELTQTGTSNTVTLLNESFGGDWDSIESSDFISQNGTAETNGNADGVLLFKEIDMTGLENGRLSLNALIHKGNLEQWGTNAGDMLKIEVIDQNGTVHLLDMFTGSKKLITGSETGQTISNSSSNISYDLPEGMTSAQIRISSDISSGGEKIRLDDVMLTAEPS
ncbi:MAG: hypothetical protein AAGI70_13305, partial [Pseudomonadota bacterium]